MQVTFRLETIPLCVGEHSCSSQTPRKGSESTLLVAIFRAHWCHRPNAEALIPAFVFQSAPAHASLSHVRNDSRLSPMFGKSAVSIENTTGNRVLGMRLSTDWEWGFGYEAEHSRGSFPLLT